MAWYYFICIPIPLFLLTSMYNVDNRFRTVVVARRKRIPYLSFLVGYGVKEGTDKKRKRTFYFWFVGGTWT